MRAPALLLLLTGLLAPPGEPRLETTQRTIGPFTITGQPYTVVLDVTRIAGVEPFDPDWHETVTGLRVLDARGETHYRSEFPHALAGDRFDESLSVGAQPLVGAGGEGILLSYGFIPSAPGSGESWQVLGVVQGRLVSFGKPFTVQGGMEIQPDPASGRVFLGCRIWTGNFSVLVLLRVDWIGGRIAPAQRCFKMTPRGLAPRCLYGVEAERRPSADLTFVRLFPDTSEEQGVAEHVVVRPDSLVEFLSAEAALAWQDGPREIVLSVSEVWLKVRVDGREGWIHRQEDLRAVGLPQAG